MAGNRALRILSMDFPAIRLTPCFRNWQPATLPRPTTSGRVSGSRPAAHVEAQLVRSGPRSDGPSIAPRRSHHGPNNLANLIFTPRRSLADRGAHRRAGAVRYPRQWARTRPSASPPIPHSDGRRAAADTGIAGVGASHPPIAKKKNTKTAYHDRSAETAAGVTTHPRPSQKSDCFELQFGPPYHLGAPSR